MIIVNKYHLDDVLKKFSIFGRYHTKAAVLLFLANTTSALSCLNYIFVSETIAYRCKEARFGNDSCASLNNFTDVCTVWEYEDPHSFVAEFNLACQEWKRVMVGTVDGIGYMVGLLIVGPLSDRFGRKKLLVITGLLSAIMGQIKSFITSYWLFIVTQFIGAMVDLYASSYILGIEMVVHEKRVLYKTITSFGFASGFAVLALAAWLFPYWRHLLRVIYGPTFLVIFYIFLLDESPRWLLTKGKKDDATKVLKKAAKMNKIELDADMLENIQYVENNSVSYVKLLGLTFTSKKLMLRIFICITWWIASTFVNYALRMNSILLPGNKYLNFAVITPTDILAKAISAIILIRFRRKIPLLASFTFAAILCFLMPFVPQSMQWLSVVLHMVGLMTSGIFFAITYVYTSEIFPTYTRSCMHGFCSSLGRIGSGIAPYSQLLFVYWKGLPSLVYGAVALTAAVITLFAPDTANDELPDTVEQAEELEKKIPQPTNSRHASVCNISSSVL